MSIPKTILFVDGENLVFRYQTLLAEGRSASPGVLHAPDVFVWHPDITLSSLMNMLRVYLYTSMTGDDTKIERMREQIGRTTYEYKYAVGAGGSALIIPRVFKRPASSRKSRQVDIQITIDMMRFAHNPGIELLCLLSGDGDYVPLVDEVMRNGKEVYVGAFSSGLAPQMRWCADEFIDLDEIFFSSPPVIPQPKKARKTGA